MDPPSGCSTVSEGRVLDVLEPGMGAVTFVLHEGLQGGDSKSCSVTVSNLGTPVAEQLSWAKGITYAALIRPGTSGAFWLADGENWDSCSDGEQSFSVYPLVLWTGGSNPDDYYPQVFTGVDLQPDWTGPSCVRESGACQDYERGYRYSVFDDKCVVQSASAGVGEAKSLNVAGSTHNVLVRRGWQELDCPIPGDTGHTAEYPDGSWVVWANRLVL